jgi:hypothetical protein
MEAVYVAVVALVVLLCAAAFFTCMYRYAVSSARAPDEAPLDVHADGV